MLTKAFNCFRCAHPFDCEEGGPRIPIYSYVLRLVCCGACSKNASNLPQRGLMEFLNQPAFKKTDDGYEYNAPFNDPVCFGCEQKIKLMEGCNAFPVHCGHFLCGTCHHKRINNIHSSCNKCNRISEGSSVYPADSRFWAFLSEIIAAGLNDKAHAPTKDNKTLKSVKPAPDVHVVKAKKARKDDTLKECGDCGKEEPVTRLLQCHDHKTIICGICFFESHQGHSVVKLLGIELDQLEKQNDKRYTETVEELHGNLQYLQKNIDNAVYKVLIAGKDRLATITKCAQYDEAQKVVSRVEDAANKFEKHCEVYIPVARELATRLEVLGEELMQEKS